MKTYYFKATDKGSIGKAFEMAIKDALSVKNANRVSPCGMCDFRFQGKAYDAKQNSSVIKYNDVSGYVRGSSRVIYATHVSHTKEQNGDMVGITIDLQTTKFYVVDKKEFIKYLDSINCIKFNQARNEINIQTVYNYKKDEYHGKKGKLIEAWCYENELTDNVIFDIIMGGE